MISEQNEKYEQNAGKSAFTILFRMMKVHITCTHSARKIFTRPLNLVILATFFTHTDAFGVCKTYQSQRIEVVAVVFRITF